MNIDSESTEMQIVSPSEDIDISSEETNKIDMSIKPQILSIQVENKDEFSVGTPEVETNKNHSRLKNLDYENSGHTGFASSKDIESINNELSKKADKNDIPDTSKFIQDESYTHTDNNYTTEEKEKLKGIEANANNYVLPDEVVKDSDYVHTDNNFTDEDKEKLDSLENFSGNASDISYEDNTGNGVNNVQDALDEVFNRSETIPTAYDITYEDNHSYDVENVQEALDNIYERVEELIFADGINYEDNYDNGVSDVQEAIDIAFAEINGLREKQIEEFNNATIDLTTLPVGVYYLSGTDTKIKYASNKTHAGLITSDEQKNVLIALGVSGINGKGIVFYSPNSTQLLMYVFINGRATNFNLCNLITSSRDETISGNWTFNKTPKCNSAPTSNIHLTNKSYVDSKFYEIRNSTDLGYIDLDDYDGDVSTFMGTLINEGKYKFIDSYDEFEWYVEVYRTDNYAGQYYWGNEEGFLNRYYRYGFYNEDEDIVEWQDWDNYISWSSASSSFASYNHVHYTTTSVVDLRTWLDELNVGAKREYVVTQTSNNHKFIVNVNFTFYNSGGKSQYIRYQEYYDIEEPNKIYKRTGKASNNTANATMTWGDWYVFEDVSGVDNVLRDILSAIQEGGTTSDTINEIEQLLVSYFENKTVEEVEG